MRHFLARLGYAVRPFDMLADRRRWWWQPRTPCARIERLPPCPPRTVTLPDGTTATVQDYGTVVMHRGASSRMQGARIIGGDAVLYPWAPPDEEEQ